MTDSTTSEPYPYGLLWGIKSSFVTYIARMPDGQGSLSDGATTHESDKLECFFPLDRETAQAEQTWSFRGDVRFSGHANMLFVRIAHPRLEARGDRTVLTIAPVYPDETARIELATVRLERGPRYPDVDVWHGTEVLLTEAGADIFNNVYAPGEPLEQFTMHVPTGDQPAQ
ncbi:HtaA domain-containing protein [Granulicoccus phenolivorans]|uniref:HtaA domain-containing protein n=1 Tax=Granulicoccus phenolivorans TaxID=266854 RepID=UPI0004149BEE|nr:HtaA domain-containing protein [Granulicoccus phenolivorans]